MVYVPAPTEVYVQFPALYLFQVNTTFCVLYVALLPSANLPSTPITAWDPVQMVYVPALPDPKEGQDHTRFH